MPNALHLCTSKAAPHISPSANLLFLAHLIWFRYYSELSILRIEIVILLIFHWWYCKIHTFFRFADRPLKGCKACSACLLWNHYLYIFLTRLPKASAMLYYGHASVHTASKYAVSIALLLIWPYHSKKVKRHHYQACILMPIPHQNFIYHITFYINSTPLKGSIGRFLLTIPGEKTLYHISHVTPARLPIYLFILIVISTRH
jgi:hypothetical protein